MARVLVSDAELEFLCTKGFGRGKAWGLREAESRGLLKRFLSVDEARAAAKDALPSCPNCGSPNTGLLPPDFETLRCEDCGRNSQLKDFSAGSPLASGLVPFDLAGPKPKKPKKDRKKKKALSAPETAAPPGVSAAGLAVRAEDTGRVLMIQRELDDNDPAGGAWEFPGGHLDPGETPFAGACREWSEEIGSSCPKGQVVAMWESPNGVYQGFVMSVPHETQVPINLDYPRVDNPDALHAKPETAAWMPIDGLHGMPTLRTELLANLPRVLPALRAPLRTVSKQADDDAPPRMMGSSIAESDVLDYLQEHYPDGDLGWVSRCLWTADNVLLDNINWQDRPGGIDEDKVDEMAEKLGEGWMPHEVVLVAPDADSKMEVADGYHRCAANAEDDIGVVRAWVGSPKPGNTGWQADVRAMQFTSNNTGPQHGD